MSTDQLQPLIESALAREVRLRDASQGYTQVQVPFFFPDGDGFEVYIRPAGNERFDVTDRAATFMHLSYHLDLELLRSGTRASLLERIQRRHGLEDREGELVLTEQPPDRLGDAVFSFVQALIEIADLRMLKRDIVRSTFRDDLERIIRSHFKNAVPDYQFETRDPDGKYRIDWLINGVPRPVALFAVPTDEAAYRAVITARQFRDWGRELHFVAVAEDQENLGRRAVALLSDTVDKQFSALAGNEEALAAYLVDQHALAEQLASLGRSGTAGSGSPTQ